MEKSKVKESFTTLMEKYFREDLKMTRKCLGFKFNLKSMKFTLVNSRKELGMALAC